MDHDDSGPSARSYHHGDLRTALLEAAEALLEESGVDRFTLRGVARRVGVSHAAPAHHFGDVRGVLTALAAIGFQGLSRAMEHESGRRDDRLVAIGRGYVRFSIERPALFSLMWRADRLDRSRQDYREPARRALGILRTTMADTYAEAGRTVEQPTFEADVRLAWSTVHGLATLIGAGQLTERGDGRVTFDAVEPWVTAVILRMAEGVRISPGRGAGSGPGPAPSARSGSG